MPSRSRSKTNKSKTLSKLNASGKLRSMTGVTAELRGDHTMDAAKYQTATGVSAMAQQRDQRYESHRRHLQQMNDALTTQRLEKQIKALKFALAVMGENVRDVAHERDECRLSAAQERVSQEFHDREKRIHEQEEKQKAEAEGAVSAGRERRNDGAAADQSHRTSR